MASPAEYIAINLGRLTMDQAANIAREIRYLWRFVEDVRPQGDLHQTPELKVTKNKHEEFTFHMNPQALKLMLLFVKDIPPVIIKQPTAGCPPEVPEFLRWDHASTPEQAGTDSPL